MGLAVAIQMDPIDTINIDADSTFALALEAQARGHALFHYLPQALTLRDGRLYARGRPLEVFRRQRQPPPLRRVRGTRSRRRRRRPDAPGPALRHGLHHRDASARTAAATRAARRQRPGLRCATRRKSCSCCAFKELMPPTLLTPRPRRDPRLLARARRHHPEAAVRQWRRRACSVCGRATRTSTRCSKCMRSMHREPVMVQRYLPEVRQGDKRIILVEGEPVGAVLRVPPEGEARANLHVGGRAVKTELTAREREICAAIGPTLQRAGAGLCRHRRDRRLHDRDQRHLADRHPGDRPARRHRSRAPRSGTRSRRGLAARANRRPA